MLIYGCFALRCSTHLPARFGKMLTNSNMYIVLPFSFDCPQTGRLLSSCSQAYQRNVVVFLTFLPYELLYRCRPTNRRIIVLVKGHCRKERQKHPPFSGIFAYGQPVDKKKLQSTNAKAHPHNNVMHIKNETQPLKEG